MAKRLLRLEPPYLFSIILAITFIYLRKFSPTYDGQIREIDLRQILLHLGYLVPFFDNVKWLNNVYWTLAIEFQYYFLISVLYFLFVSTKSWIRFAGYAVLLGAPLLFPTGNFLPFWLPLFGVGILLFLYKTGQISMTELGIASVLFVTHLFVFNSIETGVIAIATELIILFMFSATNKILAGLGKFSYSVYLVHTIVGATFVNVLSHYVTGSFAKLVLIAGGMGVTFVASYLMYLFIEKPSKKWSSRLQYNK